MRLLPSPPSRRARRPTAVPGRPPAWQRRWLRHRRLIAALLAGLVVWSLGTAMHPPAPLNVPVLLASHDLAPGTALGPDDVEATEVAADRAPVDAVTSLGPVSGRSLASVVRSGEALRARDVVAAPLLAALGPGLVATPVQLSDSAGTSLVRTGDVIDVLAATAGDSSGTATALVVAARVRVLDVPAATSSSGLFGSSDSPGSSSGGGAVIVLATTSEQALDLAQAAVGARLSLVLRAS